MMSREHRDKADTSRSQRSSASPERATNAKAAGSTPRQGLRGGRALVEERVLTAARELFAEKGFAEVTVREIGAKAGVSHALVHRYFGAKSDILAVVLRRNEEWITARAGDAETLPETALTMLREIRRNRPDYFKLVARLAMSGLPLDMPRPQFPATTRLVEVATLRAGDSAEGDASLRRRSLVASIVALAIGWTVIEDLLLPATGLDAADSRQVESALERAVLCLVDHYESEWDGLEGQ